MKIKSLMAGFVFCAAAAGAGADTAFPDPTWKVNPLPGQGRFEVIEGISGGDMRLWCEAGRYAQRHLGAGATERLYVEVPRAVAQTGRGYGVGFTIAPDAALLDRATRPGDGGNHSLTFERPGFNISVGNAMGLCNYEIDW
ncbi:MAG: hypothetical protein GYB25_11860 [Rhodobacteraceae bacterium]|nr:hypothetical protein [Paracoccaceae bacterium]